MDIPLQGYVYDSNGVLVVDPDWVETKSDIIAYTVHYKFPSDMRELLMLKVAVPFMIDGREIVLLEKPGQYMRDAIIIHYRKTP